MYTLKITIDKDILERSKWCGIVDIGRHRGKGDNCAVALAVKDIFPEAYVESTKILFDPDGGCAETHWYDGLNTPLPKRATDFIKKIDECDSEQRPNLPEFSFEISIPDEVIETINIDEVTRALEGHKNLQLTKP